MKKRGGTGYENLVSCLPQFLKWNSLNRNTEITTIWAVIFQNQSANFQPMAKWAFPQFSKCPLNFNIDSYFLLRQYKEQYSIHNCKNLYQNFL